MIASTVPGAVQVLQSYMKTVAAENDALNVAVYLGHPSGEIRDNFLMIGDGEAGAFLDADEFDWAAIPGTAKLRSESYTLNGVIRTYSTAIEDTDKLQRLTDALALLNGLHEQIVKDIGGSGKLSPSGSWGSLHLTKFVTGRMGPGWGVEISLELAVINAQLQG